MTLREGRNYIEGSIIVTYASRLRYFLFAAEPAFPLVPP